MERFEYPKSMKWLSLFSVLFFGVCAAATPTIPHDFKRLSPVLIVAAMEILFIFLAYHGYAFFRRTDDVFSATENGLDIQTRNKQFVITWHESGGNKFYQLLQHVELYNHSGEHIITIDYQLKSFDTLLKLIVSRIPMLDIVSQNEFTLSKSTHFTYIIFIVIPSLAAIGVILYYPVTNSAFVDIFVCTLCICFAVLFLISYVWAIKAVRIYPDRIQINNIIKIRTIYYEDITDIMLRTRITDEYGDKKVALFIERHGKKPIRLSGIKGGLIPIYQSIRHALNDYRIAKSPVTNSVVNHRT